MRTPYAEFVKYCMELYPDKTSLTRNELYRVREMYNCTIPTKIFKNISGTVKISKKPSILYNIIISDEDTENVSSEDTAENSYTKSTEEHDNCYIEVSTPVEDSALNYPIDSSISKEVLIGSIIKETNDIEEYSQYIPKVNSLFVPYGVNYKLIDSVVSSNDFLPMYIYGVSGIGKTMQIEQSCAKHNRYFFRCQITKDTTNEDLIGSYALENGNTVWKDGPIIKAYRCGGVILLDEIDLNPSLMILQVVLENKPMYIPQTGELVYPKKGFTVFATGNSKGDGGDSKFIGISVLNDAFLERFVTIIEQKVPSIATEQKIIKRYIDMEKINMDKSIYDNFIRWIEVVRKSFSDGDTEIYISTRRIQYILKMYSMIGDITKAMSIVLAR